MRDYLVIRALLSLVIISSQILFNGKSKWRRGALGFLNVAAVDRLAWNRVVLFLESNNS